MHTVCTDCRALFHSNVTQLLSWFGAFYDKESWQNSWVSKNAAILFCIHSNNWIQAYNPLLFNLAYCIVLTISNLDTNHKQRNSLRHWGSTIASLRGRLAVPWLGNFPKNVWTHLVMHSIWICLQDPHLDLCPFKLTNQKHRLKSWSETKWHSSPTNNA